jgi:transcriptional regulator with XRE-family HTH domain
MLKKEDIKTIIGRNLRRLRMSRSLTQDKLGAMLKPDPIDGSHIAAIEGGKGVSDNVLARLCNALNAEIWEFYLTEKAPVVKDEEERRVLSSYRKAEELQVARDVLRYCEFRVKEARLDQANNRANSNPGPNRRNRRTG